METSRRVGAGQRRLRSCSRSFCPAELMMTQDGGTRAICFVCLLLPPFEDAIPWEISTWMRQEGEEAGDSCLATVKSWPDLLFLKAEGTGPQSLTEHIAFSFLRGDSPQCSCTAFIPEEALCSEILRQVRLSWGISHSSGWQEGRQGQGEHSVSN